ncbi:MAG: sigma-70 family RNA polymerase sigma factor [Planctomycetia bacterium]|nr:sigma-70 family RNA polymerase sigma factor [Planctomycetia bacterium]
MSNRDLLEATYRAERDRLTRGSKTLFPSLTWDECEDLVQLAFVHALQECDKPDFTLQHSWLAWLRAVARFRAIDYLRRREEWSLDVLQCNASSGEGSDTALFDPPFRGQTPSEVLQQAERADRRRVLVSDLLADYVRHVEQYDMTLQREVFERSLRGQAAADIATEMKLKPQNVYDHRSRAFEWIRRQVAERDVHGSVLATVFRSSAASCPAYAVTPYRLPDVLRLALDELGAICTGEARWTKYQAAPDSADVSDIRYHVHDCRWYLDLRPHEPGCRLCQAR